MKVQVACVLLISILLLRVRSEDDDDWSIEEQQCVDELKLKKEDVQKTTNEGIVPEDNTDINNFLTCYWKKKGVQNNDGVIDYKKMEKDFIAEFGQLVSNKPDIDEIILGGVIKGAIKECKTESPQGITHGQTAAKFQNCVVGKTMKNIIENQESSEAR